jgi:hypothetical protein
MPQPIPKIVSEREMRRLFGAGGYRGRIMAGEYRPLIVYDKHRNPPLSFEPFCTRSQRVAYYDTRGDKIVEVHRYLRQDGTIGASGQADPKLLLHNGVLYQAAVR